RCPHEGYPLSQGTVDDACVLTCNWHNWKFDLETGANTMSGDGVRTYPVERRDDGHVWVDVSDPPQDQAAAKILVGLRAAFDERDHGWIARELARLVEVGVDPIVGVQAAVGWCAPRLEYGMTHAFAAAADWLALRDHFAESGCLEDQLICLTETIDHMAFDALREPEHPLPAASEAPYSADALREQIEREDADAAVATVLGAIAAGMDHAALAPTLAQAALAHYNDFGHSLIYVHKTGELLARLGAELAAPVLAAYVRGLCYATREDLIPEFRPYARALAKLPPAFGDAREPCDDAEVRALVGASLSKVFSWVHKQAEARAPEVLHDALTRACAHNILRFDAAHAEASDVKVADNIGWLDFSHGLTFASAVRRTCAAQPSLWGPALLQMACFVARNRRFLDAGEGDPLARYRVDDRQALFAELRARVCDHGLPLPIHPAHWLKTMCAVELELPHMSPSTQEATLAALRRFVHAPMKLKHARRNVHQAMALVGVGDEPSAAR
ncbi:MAG: Rieske 2Fe-2S domain-containing protein, partial [Myxococcales bacterium]|nr:Rieske 2Fe-2S domain-containing protein [Myxococcales bacterium]